MKGKHDAGTTDSRWTRRAAVGCALMAAFVAALYLLSWPLLCAESRPGAGDVIIVLGGRPAPERAKYAAELYRSGVAPVVIVTGVGDCLENRDSLVADGVPAEAILIECDARNTRQNAEFTIGLLKAHSYRRAVIVTSWYHSRRALSSFRKFSSDIQFIARPALYSGRPRRADVKFIYKEYIKTAYYAVWHGIWPVTAR